MTKINTLADRYAAAKAVSDEAAKITKALADELKALGQEVIEGKVTIVTVGLSERNTLDGKAVEAELGAEWVKAHSKTTLVESLRIKNKPQKSLVAEAIAEIAA
jgi:hypothetical protein